ncbi:MAG: LysR family transcriptional regulator [Betaproteobacteria bacterium]
MTQPAPDPLPPLNWLRAFEASARHLSFTKAAEELHLSQAAVSQQIQGLENHLGLKLFVRHTRQMFITDAGRNYLPAIQEAFATLGQGTRALLGRDRGKHLTIQSNLAFSVFWLAPRLPRLLAQYPWLNLHIVTAIWDPERTAAAADIEFRFGQAMESTRAERLGSDSVFPVCAPQLAQTSSWRDTPLFDCGGVMDGWPQWLQAQRERLPQGKTVNMATTYAVSLAIAQAGAGLALAHDTIASDLMQRKLLVRASEFSIPMRESYFLIKPLRHSETPATLAFVDWLSAEWGRPAAGQQP